MTTPMSPTQRWKKTPAVEEISFMLASVFDASEIAGLMRIAQTFCPCKDFYVVSSLKRVEWKLRTNSFAYLAKDGGRIAGFYMVEMPGIDRNENLGYELGFSENELNRVACMDSVAVHPDYRGLGLQRRLAALCEAEALARGFDIFLGTVDPRNTHSLRNFIVDGYDIVLVRESFYVEGVPRVLLMKRADGEKMSFPSLTDGTVL